MQPKSILARKEPIAATDASMGTTRIRCSPHALAQPGPHADAAKRSGGSWFDGTRKMLFGSGLPLTIGSHKLPIIYLYTHKIHAHACTVVMNF